MSVCNGPETLRVSAFRQACHGPQWLTHLLLSGNPSVFLATAGHSCCPEADLGDVCEGWLADARCTSGNAAAAITYRRIVFPQIGKQRFDRGHTRRDVVIRVDQLDSYATRSPASQTIQVADLLCRQDVNDLAPHDRRAAEKRRPIEFASLAIREGGPARRAAHTEQIDVREAGVASGIGLSEATQRALSNPKGGLSSWLSTRFLTVDVISRHPAVGQLRPILLRLELGL